MAKPPTPKSVDAIQHDDAKRKNIPTAEYQSVLDEAQKKLSDAFRALSAEALRSNNQSFLDLAKAALERFQEGARGDLYHRFR